MGKRRRRSSRDSFWTQQYGGMPVWGLTAAIVALVVAGAVAVPAALNQPAPAEAREPRPLPTMFEPEMYPLAVFIGDSYTAGAGATAPDANFPARVAGSASWRLQNLGRGGTGYATSLDGATAQRGCGLDYCPSYLEMVPDAVALEPDIVVVSGGRNGLADDEDDVARVFERLRAALPEATIMASSPVWDDDTAPDDLESLAASVREAVEGVDGYYLDLGNPLEGEPGMVSKDGIHPNNDGHAALSAAFEEALKAANVSLG